jgi:hypothetical protein
VSILRFYINKNEITSPNDAAELKEIKFSLDNAKLNIFSEKTILISGIDIIDSKNHIKLQNFVIRLPRQAGFKGSIYATDTVEIVAEVLVNKKDHVVNVIGVVDNKT